MIRHALAVAAVSILALAPLPAMADPVDDIHTATNKARADHGLAPLARSRCLDDTAQKWTDHMAYEGRLVHSDLKPTMAACDLSSAAENIAFNAPAGEVVAEWLASPGHRANLLNESYTVLGVGLNGPYATQQFGAGETIRPDRAAPPNRTATPSRGLAKTGGGR